MYVSTRARWLRVIFTYHGSALQRIKWRLLSVFVVATVLTYLSDSGIWELRLTPTPFTLIGLALGIFLGFRNNSSYDRFWEGRKLWGRLVNTTRSLARETLTFLPQGDDQDPSPRQIRIIHDVIAYTHALRMHLREELEPAELSPWLDEAERAELAGHLNIPAQILLRLGRRISEAVRSGNVSEYRWVELERRLVELMDIQGGCERIKTTPIPYSYTILIHRIVALYTFGLPFGLVDILGRFTPFVVIAVAYTFLGLDAVGDEIEDPFGKDINDLPLTRLSTMIEINLRQALGETNVPTLPPPKKCVVD